MAPDPTMPARELALSFGDWLDARAGALAAFRREPYRSVGEYLQRLRPFQRLLFDEGWSRLGWPVALGGLGGHPSLRGVVYDAIYRRGLDLPRGFELLEVVGPTIAHYAPTLAAEQLPRLMRGDVTVCQGFSEPDAGSDLAALRTRADVTDQGLVLTGQKTWISLANVADYSLVLARTGTREARHRAITALWVDLAAPGVTTTPIAFADGTDEFAEVFFDGVLVTPDAVVGTVGGGWDVAMYLLQFERGTYAWQRQAWLTDVLAGALRGPVQDGRGSKPATEAAQAWLDLVSLRSRCRRTLLRLAAGERLGARTSVDKLLMTRAERAVLDAARALTWPQTEAARDRSRWEDDWFYSRAASVYGGASEVQRDIVADKLIGLPR